MSRRFPRASVGDANPDTRPLPPRPNLERERKHAKALLRQLRAGDPDAFARARARHPALRPASGAPVTLADAQLVVAREYGFTSWPRLVQYFRDVERQRMARHSTRPLEREFYEHNARSLISHHRDRRANAGRSLAASVPRFYGKTVDEVFASSVSEDDARLTVARENGCASWDVLMETIEAERARQADPWSDQLATLKLASTAINAGDLDALTRVVAEHPELLRPSVEERREWRTVVAAALAAEEQGVAGARAITDWLASQGAEVGLALNERLCGRMFLTTANVRFLLERGADPNWIAPNGISVLEHALLRYWNGDAVDLIAQRATPSRALWIAAGLGDVDGMSRFLDRNGKPTPAVYRDRPDFAAVGPPSSMLSTPVPDATEVLAEAFFVAMVNDRITVLDYMIDRGFPVDYLGWEMPFVSFAAGNQRVRVVECLVRRGADLDVRGRHPDMSAREMARERFENMPTNPTARRILELCGLDPEQVIAEMQARPAPEPQITRLLQQALELAGDDAARQQRPGIGPDNLLVGTLRVSPGGSMELMRAAGVDAELLRAEIGVRVLPAPDRVERGKLLLDGAAQDVMRAAIAIARQRKQDAVFIRHVVRALADTDDVYLRDLLGRCGSSMAKLRERLESVL
jgi:Clp amino terminal domain, pathogenicity island component